SPASLVPAMAILCSGAGWSTNWKLGIQYAFVADKRRYRKLVRSWLERRFETHPAFLGSASYNRRMTNPPATILLLTTCLTAIAQNLPTVVVLSTGGTIASKQDPAKGGYVPALSGEDLVTAVPAVKKIAQIQVEQISNIGSPDMTPEIWVRLAGRVNELLAKPEIAGAVVTHGTDTLEETAYFL